MDRGVIHLHGGVDSLHLRRGNETEVHLGLSEGAIRVNVCRLRKEFRAALFATIADTLDEPTDESIRAEVRTLIEALGA